MFAPQYQAGPYAQHWFPEPPYVSASATEPAAGLPPGYQCTYGIDNPAAFSYAPGMFQNWSNYGPTWRLSSAAAYSGDVARRSQWAPRFSCLSRGAETWIGVKQSCYKHCHPSLGIRQQLWEECNQGTMPHNSYLTSGSPFGNRHSRTAAAAPGAVTLGHSHHQGEKGCFLNVESEMGTDDGRCCIRPEISSQCNHEEADGAQQGCANDWGHISALALSSCLLCGNPSHHYTGCWLFDGKTLCFIHIADSLIYAMHHDHWVERATLNDICSFVLMAVGIPREDLLLYVGHRVLDMATCKTETRCCELRLLPGAVARIAARSLVTLEGGELKDGKQEEFPVKTNSGRCEDLSRPVECLVSFPVERGSEYPASQSVVMQEEESVERSAAREGCNDETESMGNCALDRDVIKPTSDGESSDAKEAPMPDQCDSRNGKRLRSVSATSCDKEVLRQKCKETPRGESYDDLHEESDNTHSVQNRRACVNAVKGESTTDSDDKRRLRTVHVRFIPVSMSFCYIRALLWSCGEVHKVRLVKPKATANPSKMFYVCFAEYAHEEGAVKMLSMHGHRVADSFHLAVEVSKHAIYGGYITDFDVDTGKPCTFGMSDTERWAVERRHKESSNVSAGQSSKCGEFTGDAGNVDRPKEGRRRRGGRKHHAKMQESASPAEGAKDSGNAEQLQAGAYSLHIVAKEMPKGKLNRGGCCSIVTNATKGVKEPTQALSRQPDGSIMSMVYASPALTCENETSGSSNEKELMEYLRRVTKTYTRCLTQRMFYEALIVVEDIKLLSPSVFLRVELAKTEAALLILHRTSGFEEAVTAVAEKMAVMGSELLQEMTADAPCRARAGDQWGPLFTSLRPSLQACKANTTARNDDGCKTIKGVLSTPLTEGLNSASTYPRIGKVLRLTEGLLHVALLLDYLLEHVVSYSDEKKTVKSDIDIASSDAQKVMWKITLCARCILQKLQIFVAEDVKCNPEEQRCATLQWVRSIARVLTLLPNAEEGCVGDLLGLFVPYVVDLPSLMLDDYVDLCLF
uniref:WGS project CAEQ00000000 data, annotated contig 1340 n=1 Tax=Trypanosoma congolense (strain IL3000) TaxID=1068625 RepID=F9W5L8_TRYCI|nr:unnamed protein product [Trypanosoma congolense IL3000]